MLSTLRSQDGLLSPLRSFNADDLLNSVRSLKPDSFLNPLRSLATSANRSLLLDSNEMPLSKLAILGRVGMFGLTTFCATVFVQICQNILRRKRTLRCKKMLYTDTWHHFMFGVVTDLLKNWERMHHFYFDLFEIAEVTTFGAQMSLMQNIELVYTIDPKNVRFMLCDNFNQFIKGPINQFCKVEMGEGIFFVDHGPHAEDKGTKWKGQRRASTSVFKQRGFDEFLFTQWSQKMTYLKELLTYFSKSGKSVDISRMYLALTMDAFMEIGFGLQADSLLEVLNYDAKNKKCPGLPKYEAEKCAFYAATGGLSASVFAENFDYLLRATCSRFTTPGFIWRTQRLFQLTSMEQKITKSNTVTTNFCQKLFTLREKQIENGEQSASTCQDFLSYLLNVEKDFTPKECRDFLIAMILGGRDTTASALMYGTFLLARDRLLQDRVAEEIINGPELTFDNLMESDSFPFLHGIVWEFLRIHPPVPVNTKTPVRDVQLPSGDWVAKNSFVHYNIGVMCRSEELWPNAMEIRPERWIDFKHLSEDRKSVFTKSELATTPDFRNGEKFQIRPKVKALLEPNVYFMPVFQAGSRECTGRRLALFEIKYGLAYLCKHFMMRLKDPIIGKTFDSIPTENGAVIMIDMKKGCEIDYIERI